eukprot:438933-Prorocentrum_minimum.AAC.8
MQDAGRCALAVGHHVSQEHRVVQCTSLWRVTPFAGELTPSVGELIPSAGACLGFAVASVLAISLGFVEETWQEKVTPLLKANSISGGSDGESEVVEAMDTTSSAKETGKAKTKGPLVFLLLYHIRNANSFFQHVWMGFVMPLSRSALRAINSRRCS